MLRGWGKWIFAAGVAGSIGVPVSALAAMTYLPDTGTTARARGGAFTARADDPMAIVYNPAGFADQRKMQVYFDVTMIKLMNSFDRTGCADSDDPSNPGNPQPSPCGGVSNTGAPKISPNIIFSMPIGDRLTWHAGAHGATGTNHKYPANGPQRFVNVEQDPQQLSYTAGHAYRPMPWVSIGFTAGGMYTTNKQKLVSTRNTAAPPNEHPANDSPVILDVSDSFTPTGIVGAKFTAVEPGVELGLSYRPALKTSMGGTYKSPSAGLSEPVHLEINLPSVARVGFRKFTPGWDVEVDFSVEDWTSRKADVIRVDDGDFFGASELVIDREGQMAFRLGVGGTYQMGESLELHGGVLHETAGVTEERLNVTLQDAPKTQLSVGTSYTFARRFEVSGSVSYTHYQTVTVTNSSVTQRGPLPSTPVEAYAVTGNGKYTASSVMAGFSFLTRF